MPEIATTNLFDIYVEDIYLLQGNLEISFFGNPISAIGQAPG
jgi:hypothetical protein